MIDKLDYILITVFGIFMILPLLGVSALGSLVEGITAWIVSIIIIVIGIRGLTKSK